MATRTKKIVQTGVSKEQMETSFSDYAKAEAEIAKINATIDVEVTKIRDKYADKIANLQQIKDDNFDVLQAYALENRDTLFTKKKSLDSLHGTIGFRTTLKGFTWGAVTNLLKEFLPQYVRLTEEPAKDKLLADREDEQIATLFPKVGISVVQDETFFVEVKKEAE